MLTRERLLISENLPVTLSWAIASPLYFWFTYNLVPLLSLSVTAAWDGMVTVSESPFSCTPNFEKFNRFWQSALILQVQNFSH